MFTKARTITALFLVTVVASLAVSLGAASPAGAQMRICTSAICVASQNSCWLTLPNGGGELIFDDGDSFTSAAGQKWTCVHGTWVVTAAAPTTGILAPGFGQILPGH